MKKEKGPASGNRENERWVENDKRHWGTGMAQVGGEKVSAMGKSRQESVEREGRV